MGVKISPSIDKKMLLALFFLLPIVAGSDSGKGALSGQVLLDDSQEKGAIVYVVGFEEAAPAEPQILQQISKKFIPAFLPITKGQFVEIINKDQVRHNVFSISATRKFDLGLTGPHETHKIIFNTPGVVDVYCNIHPEMVSTILVLPNRAYARADHEGHYQINNIPTGKFTVYAWHPLAQSEHQQVSIKEGATTKIEWKLHINKKTNLHLNKFGRPYSDRKKY
jgi:plastocyanin